MKRKKELPEADGWEKVPIWQEVGGEIVVDSTPIMRYIDSKHNNGSLFSLEKSTNKVDKWMTWVDDELSKATVPLIYGSLGRAIRTTRQILKVERFGFFHRWMIAFGGFFVMWFILGRRRTKKLPTKPEIYWTSLIDDWCQEIGTNQFFNGENISGVDLAVFGIFHSITDLPGSHILPSHKSGSAWFEQVRLGMKSSFP